MGIRVFWQSQRQSPHGPGQSPSGNFQSHQPHHFLNPALRVNNGMTLDMDTASQGFANRVRRVPNSIFPPSSTGNLEEDGLNNPGGQYSPLRFGLCFTVRGNGCCVWTLSLQSTSTGSLKLRIGDQNQSDGITIFRCTC